jgi:hypothetical protein
MTQMLKVFPLRGIQMQLMLMMLMMIMLLQLLPVVSVTLLQSSSSSVSSSTGLVYLGRQLISDVEFMYNYSPFVNECEYEDGYRYEYRCGNAYGYGYDASTTIGINRSVIPDAAASQINIVEQRYISDQFFSNDSIISINKINGSKMNAPKQTDTKKNVVVHEQCRIYLAESTIPNAGWGLFVGVDVDKNEIVSETGDAMFLFDSYLPVTSWIGMLFFLSELRKMNFLTSYLT